MCIFEIRENNFRSGSCSKVTGIRLDVHVWFPEGGLFIIFISQNMLVCRGAFFERALRLALWFVDALIQAV